MDYESIKNYKNTILEKLNNELNNYIENETILISTFLIIRFKKLSFLILEKKEKIYNIIENYLKNNEIIKEINDINIENNFFDELIDDINNTNGEFKNYLNDNNFTKETEPLIWWNFNKTKYPVLFSLAKKYLIIPATSIVDERENSKLGNTITKIRNKLSPNHAILINFLSCNNDFW